MEIWKDITNFEGRYQVSNKGRFFSLPRSIVRNDGTVYTTKGKEIKTTFCDRKGGFLVVQLFKDGVTTARRASRVVAEHFLEPPNEKLLRPVIGFLDGDRTNISSDNLYWLDAKDYDTADGVPVPGFDNLYITNSGVAYRVKDGKHKVLRGSIHPQGYVYVGGKTTEGKKITAKVHRLVATIFVPKPDPSYTQVDHIDGDPSNNHYTNLRWCTNQMNQQYKLRTTQFVPYIKYYISQGLGDQEIANMYGLRKLVVNRIRNGKTYQNIKMEKPNDTDRI